MTVTDVAQRAQVTERTVRRDIAAGRLPVRKGKDGRLRIFMRDVHLYRSTRVLRQPYMKIEAYASMIGVSLRKMRRLVANGRIKPVRVSPRRMFIPESEHRRLFGMRFRDWGDGTVPTYQPPDEVSHDGTGPEPWPHTYISVAELARRAHTTVRHIHHDIHKGAIPRSAIRQWAPGSMIWIEESAAHAYVGHDKW